jgi:hypothetical protein
MDNLKTGCFKDNLKGYMKKSGVAVVTALLVRHCNKIFLKIREEEQSSLWNVEVNIFSLTTKHLFLSFSHKILINEQTKFVAGSSYFILLR